MRGKKSNIENDAFPMCFSKHIKLEINVVDLGINLSKESSIYQFCPSNAASVFESLSN